MIFSLFTLRRNEPDRAGPGQHKIGATMDDQFFVTCPYCGESIEIYVESDVLGAFVQDCEVCCNPWRVRVRGKGDERSVDVTRADGSE